MPETKIQDLLVIGIDTVAIANSAKKAGYKIYAADYFGDVDLRRVCEQVESIVKQQVGKSCGRMKSKCKPEAFLRMAKSLLESRDIDAILLSSGLDDAFSVLRELNDLAPILGNHPKVIERIRKKMIFFKELKNLGITCPETRIVRNIEEAEAAAIEMEFPVVIKPIAGFGGVGIKITQNLQDVAKNFLEASLVSEEILVQKFIDGVSASISFLANGKDARILTVNEQLLGLHFLFQKEPFGYCGNIVPLYFANSIFEKCRDITEKISQHFGLKGSNGIDLVISEEGEPYVMEVNPRFQGSLECVEKILGINLVESHINACLYGSLPIVREASAVCTRLILYTSKRSIAPDLTVFPEVRDVPISGTIIEKGEPICSVITKEKNRNYSLLKAKKLAKLIYNMLYPA